MTESATAKRQEPHRTRDIVRTTLKDSSTASSRNDSTFQSVVQVSDFAQMRPRLCFQGEHLCQRDIDTIDVVENILTREEVEIRELRKVSAVRGLVTSALRTRVWPQLLHVDLSQQLSSEDYHALAQTPNEFSNIIKADVHRSLFNFYDATQERQRWQQRIKLERLLNAVVNFHKGTSHAARATLRVCLGDVHYYQGLHDIASILLLTLGEALAFALLCKMTTVRLRDCTQRTLDPVAELLKLQVPILRKLDPSLARHLETMNIPCYFAISWFITWFSHDVPQFHEVCRLFDFFFATHPMMPLYVGAVGMHAAREELLNVDEMSELHKSLVNLHIGQYQSTDELIFKAISLYHRHPPRRVCWRIINGQFQLEHPLTRYAGHTSGSCIPWWEALCPTVESMVQLSKHSQ